MKRWMVITVTIVLFLGILFGGSAIFESLKPAPPKSGFYKNGLYLDYKLEWGVDTLKGPIRGLGVLVLKVIKNKININVTLPHFYPSNSSLYRDVNLNVSGDNITYKGEKVILPFFYSGGKAVSYYKGSYVNATGKADIFLATLQGGIIRFQPVYYLYPEICILYPNGTVWNKGAPSTYEYGKNTNLLFFINSPIGWDPVIDFLLNLTYPEKLPNGTIFNDPINFGLSLHRTNLDLGPVDYFAVLITYIVVALPVILVIGIPLIIIGIYRVVKNRRVSDGKINRDK